MSHHALKPLREALRAVRRAKTFAERAWKVQRHPIDTPPQYHPIDTPNAVGALARAETHLVKALDAERLLLDANHIYRPGYRGRCAFCGGAQDRDNHVTKEKR